MGDLPEPGSAALSPSPPFYLITNVQNALGGLGSKFWESLPGSPAFLLPASVLSQPAGGQVRNRSWYAKDLENKDAGSHLRNLKARGLLEGIQMADTQRKGASVDTTEGREA